jgi:hypothetical protein
MTIHPLVNRIFFNKLSTPGVLLVMAFISFGLFANQQGLYWDDWNFAWTRAHLGQQGLLEIFGATRPIRGTIEAWLTYFLGNNLLLWQIYSITTRWLAALSCQWFMLKLWPEQKWQATLTAMFFLVYPGFSQQSLALTYHYFWTFNAILFLSMGLMVKAAGTAKPTWSLFLVSVALGGLVLWAMEYLFGLELLRPFFLWLALKPNTPNPWARLRKTIHLYMPSLIVTSTYLYWRLIVYKDSIYTIEQKNTSDLVDFIAAFIPNTFQAISLVSIGAWKNIIGQPFLYEATSPRLVYLYGLIIIGGSLLLFLYFKQHPDFQNLDNPPASRNVLTLFGIATLTLITSGIPFFVLNLPIRLDFPENRFTLAFIFGVSLLITAILNSIRDKTTRWVLAALIIPLAISLHIHNSDTYRQEFNSQRSFMWQLHWRAPYIRPHTAFMSENQVPFPHNDAEAFTFMVNWAYEPDANSRILPYGYFDPLPYSGNSELITQPGLPLTADHFSAEFSGNTDQLLMIVFSPPSCLRILDPRFDSQLPVASSSSNNQPPLINNTLLLPQKIYFGIHLSNPAALIALTDRPIMPLKEIFGEEPEKRWCYYFEKADLARQSGDWKKVASLGDQAFHAPYYPDDPSEYLPFIEAYGRLERLQEAQVLTSKMLNINPMLHPAACSIWQRVAQLQINPSQHAEIDTIIDDLQYCPTEAPILDK